MNKDTRTFHTKFGKALFIFVSLCTWLFNMLMPLLCPQSFMFLLFKFILLSHLLFYVIFFVSNA